MPRVHDREKDEDRQQPGTEREDHPLAPGRTGQPGVGVVAVGEGPEETDREVEGDRQHDRVFGRAGERVVVEGVEPALKLIAVRVADRVRQTIGREDHDRHREGGDEAADEAVDEPIVAAAVRLLAFADPRVPCRLHRVDPLAHACGIIRPSVAGRLPNPTAGRPARFVLPFAKTTRAKHAFRGFCLVFSFTTAGASARDRVAGGWSQALAQRRHSWATTNPSPR